MARTSLGHHAALVARWAISLVLVAPLCRAQASPSDLAVAESLFRAAKDLMNERKFAEACPKLRESYRLDPKLGTLLNLAICHESDGKTASAWGEFNEAAGLARQKSQPERERFAADHARALEPNVPKLLIAVESSSSTEVRLDGRVLDAALFGTAIPVDPGEHTASATAPGKQAWSYKVSMAAGQQERIEVPRLADEVATNRPAPIASQRSAGGDEVAHASGRRVIGYVVAGVGLVGVGVGTYFGLHASSLHSDGNAHCQATACDPEGIDLQDQARSAASLSTVGFAVGVVGLATGAYLVLTSPRDASSRAVSSLRLDGVASPSYSGLTVNGTW
jgi:hypothetical protein